MAERGGFEPPVLFRHSRSPGVRVKPLCHLSTGYLSWHVLASTASRLRQPIAVAKLEAGTARRAVRGRLGEATLPKPDLRPYHNVACHPRNRTETVMERARPSLIAVISVLDSKPIQQ